jgi:hypothetical protein
MAHNRPTRTHLDAAYNNFATNRPTLTAGGRAKELEIANAIQSARDVETHAMTSDLRMFDAGIPHLRALYALRNSSVELQLWPDVNELGRHEESGFPDWVGDLMRLVEKKKFMRYTVIWIGPVSHPDNLGDSESFCFTREGLLLLPGVELVAQLLQHIRRLAKTCPEIPEGIRAAIRT